MKVFLVFIILVLAVGCRSQQPAVFTPCDTDTITLIDTTTIVVKDKDAIKLLFECDSLNAVQWGTSAELAYLLDSVSAIEAKIIYKNKIVYKTLHSVSEKVVYRDKIVYKLHPITWAFALILLLLLIFLLLKK